LETFPMRNEYYFNREVLEETSCHKLQDALGGVGYMLVTGEMLKEATDKTFFKNFDVSKDYGKTITIADDMFFLLDECDDEES
ncbi:hypothetical protein, partial [Staphylococcus aureus]|uniref:hypothetical protein n=1 Tax=Staphylococcus aureus TaxID=1280 RepID=UPI00203D0ED3